MGEIKFQPIEREYYPVATGFRPNTPMFPMKMGFMFFNGGFGDYFNWLRPIQWLCEEATWIEGIAYVPDYLVEIATYFTKNYPKWQVKTYKDLESTPRDSKIPLRGPINLQTESLNATGAHLFTCGWVYFTNKDKAPAHNDSKGMPWSVYPQFEQSFLDQVPIPDKAKDLEPGKYAIITTGVTTPSRFVKPEYFNYIIDHVKSHGLTPVFLGKRVTVTGNRSNIHTQFSDKVRYDLGVDLLDQTTLLQAASIISRSRFIVGHDNGLLHLAGGTQAPIVFGYNLASPEHRRPLRVSGKVYDVTLTRDELACIHCQSNTNFVVAFNFRQCFYGDLRCMDLLFADKAKKWRTAIDQVLKDEEVNKELSQKNSGSLSL